MGMLSAFRAPTIALPLTLASMASTLTLSATPRAVAAGVESKSPDFMTWTSAGLHAGVPLPRAASAASGQAIASTTITNEPICTAIDNQLAPRLIPDGGGGGIVVWYDNRSGSFDIYAQKVSAAGVPQWAINGVPV